MRAVLNGMVIPYAAQILVHVVYPSLSTRQEYRQVEDGIRTAG